MMPIPPLDGGRVAVGLLPNALAYPLARLEPYGMLILIGALILLPLLGAQLGLNLDVISTILRTLTNYVIGAVLFLTGNLRADTRARADFATWKMMAKLNGASALPQHAQDFLLSYQ
ncbi:hypothetical protein KXV85_005198, partial [Aspergillus fumigatus]